MSPTRQHQLMKTLMTGGDITLTDEEIAAGWHLCYEWDLLLVGPGMPEMDCCRCLKKSLGDLTIAPQ